MDDNLKFQNAFNYKVIYAFTIDDEVHKGLVKIGDATLNTNLSIDKLFPNCRELNQAALKRIKKYTNTAGVTPNLLYTELALKEKHGKDGIKLFAFRDYQVHSVLENSGIHKVKIDGSTGREWFRIEKDTVIEAIQAVKNNYANLSNTKSDNHVPIIFRPEQKEAIERTVKQFKKSNRMLWNAKMRFGKTLSALEVIRRCNFQKTIILTHRPVVNDGWYEDFRKIFYGTEFRYGSKSNGYDVKQLNKLKVPYVYFASIQDLRGSEAVGGKFGKNEDIFDTVWDLVIVDEAHEGTKTSLGDETIKAILKEEQNKTKLLSLSGTPFNILDEYDENSIYTWDYIMEQECKSEWDKLHFGDSNPYEELPEMKIYTYDLGDLLHNTSYITYEDKAFNFHEFFRTWTGDFKYDYAQMPVNAKIGDFVHEKDVWSLLNLMTKKDEKNSYPYSRDEYRDLFKHSLWMVPGVREAKALKELMLKHPVFGNGQFDVVNVAGSDDEESADALNSVRTAIERAEKMETYTITLSCGKLTTGVTVKEWTAVFMLSGTYSTSAANYLQTIFRVQSPCNKDGKMKDTCYVFDFAPDRTLKMVSEAVSVSAKAGKTGTEDKVILGKFLNYCPVISISGSQMKEYKADRLLQQLKKAYADKVVRNGFDDSNLYNDELLKLNDLDIKKFDELKRIVGKSKAAGKQNDITVNDQGLTNEEYEKQEKLNKKPKKELTEEEKQFLEELKKKKKLRNDAISILRGISIRMPLLIYGADVPYYEEITLEKFVEQVDDSSWYEFMPDGVTKEVFENFKKYYDEDVFIEAGRRIRNISREADTLPPTERVKKIASLFSNFKNPDKETVLTPWRVVNMHLSTTLGGYDFWDIDHKHELDKPRYVNHGKITQDTFGNTSAQILEINSKTGLYPLYVTYSIYRVKCENYKEELTTTLKKKLWNETIKNNVFVICKTPMAKQITQRTLVGYTNIKINAHYFDDLVNQMQNKSNQFRERVLKSSYWKKGDVGQMKFDAVVGNPPYQLTVKAATNGNNANTIDIFQYFQEMALQLSDINTLIYPAKELQRGKMNLMDKRLVKVRIYNGSNKESEKSIPGEPSVFGDAVRRIPGDVGVYLWDLKNPTEKINYQDVLIDRIDTIMPVRKEYFKLAMKLKNYVERSNCYSIKKCCESNFVEKNKNYVLGEVEDRKLKAPDGYVKVFTNDKGGSGGKSKWYYIKKDKLDYLQPEVYKVIISSAFPNEAFKNPNNIEVIDKDEMYGRSKMCLYYSKCKSDALNFKKYSRTIFFKNVVEMTPQKFLYYLPNFDEIKNDIDWEKSLQEIDQQLCVKFNLSEDDIIFSINE